MNPLRIGRGCQVAGLALIVLALVILGYLLTRPPRDWHKARYALCVNNFSQVGLAFRTYAMDNDDHFPFNVSTNAGGTREFCAMDSEGFDSNAALHFQLMSNELYTPILLVCPKDWSRKPAASFRNLRASNVTYRVHSGIDINMSNSTAVLLLCPFDGNTLQCDGSVTQGKADWKPPGMTLMDAVRYRYLEWMSMSFPVFMVSGLVLLWAGSRLKWKAKRGPKPLGLILGEAWLVILALLIIALMLNAPAYF